MTAKHLQAIAVAITIVTGVFFLGYYSTYLAWEDLRPWRSYQVTFARTLGLAKDDDVYVYGYKIGRVHQISLQGDHQLAQVQVDPSVRFYREGLRVVIEPVNAFGTVGVFVEPGEPESGYWDPDIPIAGAFRESLEAGPEDSATPRALSESLKEFEALTTSFTKIDGVGWLVNDPDPAVAFRAGMENTEHRLKNVRDSFASIAAGEGFGALLANDQVVVVNDSVRGMRDSIRVTHESLGEAARGEPGLAGRFLGDRDAAQRTRETLRFDAGLFKGYMHGEGAVTGALSHPEEPSEWFGGLLDALATRTDEGRRGEGQLGGLLGPEGGQGMRESVHGFAGTLSDMTAADARTGTFFSRSAEGRRTAEDFATRIEDVLRDMRKALGRIRADQAPNTFPGALFSVF